MNRSIKRQLIYLIVGTFAVSFIILALLNNFFIERYYESNKTNILNNAYTQLDSLEKDYNSATVSNQIIENASRNNLQYVILDDSFNTVFMTNNAALDSGSRLFGYYTGIYRDEIQVISETGGRTIQKTRDIFQGLTYLEIWGTLANGNYCLIRTPIESIKETADISGKFFFIIGSVVVILSLLITWIFSGRLTKPITRLTDISKRMAQLDFNARYVPKGRVKNEIDVLGEHFNVMSDELEKNISGLKTANAKLEKDIEYKSRIDEQRREFINNVSHELKTPIAVIQGYAEGLKENIADDEESRNYYYDVIIDESVKMNKLVRQLLDIDAIESGNDAPDIRRFDIDELIKTVMSNLDLMFKSADAVAGYESRGPVYVWGDEFKIEEVINNYLNNAINHLSGDKNIKVRCTEKDNKVTVSVFNNGEPIPDESFEFLWDKFYKADKARTRQYGGSGIGLSIVKAIMDAHGGAYFAENKDDGVEFSFTLDKA